ncbi:MFS transporter, DHA1 family, chloramphenicol resistance protein [Lentzea waywayandensis]|uniref:MFS transporter, DHA1 family, chloramphenicol resistance protein n=1 Tax=Lentzea waywayandensis TaxID=84724 RepID=A0A1I6EJT4_9PSEU|nr:Cmx/CmrA family chloramphenicol efflux MFS transporter [Lentzea waywayandensis]SFR18024.1 MFS transporter, DHA1 family, chloramphenicol resistance protein [Lentzea waywayandensis]
MPLSLYLLALAVFAMGTSEFMLSGLLPAIAVGFDVSVGTAGQLTSAFAAGMVVGAPLMAALARNWPPRLSLFTFVAVFLAAHVIGAVTGSFAVLLVTRVVAALANAGFLAVALTTATALAPPQRRGRALAVLLSGTTVATIAGVPGGALLGTAFGWRATFLAVAVLCVPAAVGVLKGIPSRQRHTTVALRPELAELRKPRLVLVIALAVLVNAVTFGHFTFLAPVVTDVAGLGEWWVPVVLVLFGLGSFAGVHLGGRLSGSAARPVVVIGGVLMLAGWFSLDVLGREPVVLLALVFVLGVLSFAVGSALIAKVLHHAAEAPTMAGSYATAALNIGAVAGPLFFVAQ